MRPDIKAHNDILNTMLFVDKLRKGEDLSDIYYDAINNATYYGTKEGFFAVFEKFHAADLFEIK